MYFARKVSVNRHSSVSGFLCNWSHTDYPACCEDSMNRRILTVASGAVQQLRGIKKHPFPVTFENVVFPPNGQMKLPSMPTEPFYDAEKGEYKYKTTKRMIEARGVEEIHTDLIHKQYGLAAISGGFISSADFKFLEDRINKNLIDKQFAIWRVDPPWLPRTKKAQGTRLGGGKGSIQKYVTPVRANRIILEVGGHITEVEARAFLMYLCERFSFPAEFVSEEILQERRQEEARIRANNTNKFDWDKVIKYNMQNCTSVDGMRGDDELISIPFRHIVYCVAGLPLSALFICIFLSITLHIDDSTRTHCGVDNWLPSVSAAVASFSPERYIWRVFIGLHGAPRLILALAFRNLLLSSPIRSPSTGIWFAILCQLACFLNLAENIFLLLLTSISSVEDHESHKICFIGFAICAISYMFLTTWLYNFSNRRQLSHMGEKSYQYKLLYCCSSVVSIIFACYFYYRHNTYCEPGVYTLFALSEYTVIISNILFHSTAYFDFEGRKFTLSAGGSVVGDYQTLLPMHDDKRII
ncbi:hypothetical protein QR680_011463 [Steinernema hermaphroditum]|uniref:CWH43-like N-terminal domain-containing protein n=1 Tax=Steinernema hermaphroditum TaxID=289476 RepID=A0AA39I0B7_9BILA|nr:hypothetical protein QR680_011463 [Steinernema hermaphroditum]